MQNAAVASPESLIKKARRCIGKKQYVEAERCVQEVLRNDTANADALALQGDIFLAKGLVPFAFTAYMKAIEADPENVAHLQKFIAMAGDELATAYDPLIEKTLVSCLRSADRLDLKGMQRLWSSLIIQHPAFLQYGLTTRRWFDPANEAFFSGLTDLKPLLTPCFLLGLRHLVVQNALFEEFVTHLRRHLLEDLDAHRKLTAAESLTLAAALSHYSFFTDYILNATEEEKKKTAALRRKIESGKAGAEEVAVFACYEPLCTLKNRAAVAKAWGADAALADVVQMQIADYEALQATAKEITAITPIEDETSAKVREQYETFPYPRWKYFSADQSRREWDLYLGGRETEGYLLGKKSKILIAGCGTGYQVAGVAAVFPDADILAVDLSRASMAYAINKAKEYGIKNVTFRQADILKLGELPEKFDYITTTGVLHHLRDPLEGWQVLTGLLKPGGVMRVGLYSKIARRHLMEAQKIIRDGGYARDADSMRAFRKKSVDILGFDLTVKTTEPRDYYYLSMYRDLLFHVQERCYDWLEIGEVLKEAGLEFAGVPVSAEVAAQYARLNPGDPKRMSLEGWHRYEQAYPDVFRAMYIFWCRKPKD